MLHVLALEKRRVKPGALLDLVVIGKIADEDVNDLFFGFVDIGQLQADKQLVHAEKKKSLGSSFPYLGTVSSCLSRNNVSASLEGPVQIKIWHDASLTVTADSTLSSKAAPAVAFKRHAHATWTCCTGCSPYREIESRWSPFTETGVTAWSNVCPRPTPSE